MKSIFIGFDFSMNKPAATILYEKQFYHFVWPLSITDKQAQLYSDAGVYVYNRKLESISTKDKNSQIVLQHTIRSTELSDLIIKTLDAFIEEHDAKECPIYVSSEGLSYGSKGDAALNLATYKGVLLSDLYRHYYGKMYGLYTYSPITLKATAGQAGKNKIKSKTPMIDAFMKEPFDNNLFHTYLINGKFINKTALIPCVDDIIDSYWALKTMLKKEGFIK